MCVCEEERGRDTGNVCVYVCMCVCVCVYTYDNIFVHHSVL